MPISLMPRVGWINCEYRQQLQMSALQCSSRGKAPGLLCPGMQLLIGSWGTSLVGRLCPLFVHYVQPGWTTSRSSRPSTLR